MSPPKNSKDPTKIWNPEPHEIKPNAKKPTGRENPKSDHKSRNRSQRGKSQKLTDQFADPNLELLVTPEGIAAYEGIVASAPDIDLTLIREVEERETGDIEKIMLVLQSLAMGARHREALSQVDWTWSNLSVYRSYFPVVANLYKKVTQLGDELRKAYRLDEAHRRAVDGVEEPIYAPNGRLCGHKVKYSDALLTLLLKSDDPEKFSDRVEVKSTGVVLNMQMGLRKDVSDTMMEPGDITTESPFADEKPEEPPE